MKQEKTEEKQMHNDSISLLPDFELPAAAKTCHNQLMKHRDKSLYSCRFHPEFYHHELIQNFLKIVVKESLRADKLQGMILVQKLLPNFISNLNFI